MNKTILLILSVVLAFSFSLHAQQPVKIRKQVSQTIQKLAQNYKQEKDLLSRKVVALSEFSEDSQLAKKHNVGKVLRDLVSSELSRSTVFELIERSDLEKVVKEQQLQMTGLTDPSSASKVGAIMNADLLLLGNVTELGDEFMITIKLIDVETGAVISESASFKKSDAIESADAILNMAYVQKMGLGIAFNILGQSLSGDNPAAITGVSLDNTTFGYPFGLEVRYRLTRNFMLGVGLDMVSAQVWYNPSQRWEVPVGQAGQKTNTGPFQIYADGIAIPITLYGNINLTRRLNLFAGGGVMMHRCSFSGIFKPSIGNGFGLNEFGPVLDNKLFVGYQVLGGIEFFLNPRVAISARAGYDSRRYTLDLKSMWHLPGLPQELALDMGGFSYQANLAFYF